MKKKTALITGITGQDGSYLAELLLKKNSLILLSSTLIDLMEKYTNSYIKLTKSA